MTPTAAADRVRVPSAPRTAEETGLASDLILQIAVKTLNFAGELLGTDLASRLGVQFPVLEQTLEFLKRERHVEISGGGAIGPSAYRYRLTDAGRTRAQLFFGQSQYVGRLPVPLKQYTRDMLNDVRKANPPITREQIRRAFDHLVLSDRVLDQLGPALASKHSLFIYGPPGNGKTVVAQALRNVFIGDISIPHALSVEGHIIRLFDPVNHEPLATDMEPDGLYSEAPPDERWIRCRRPLVTVGGELTLDALELGDSSSTGFYRAPVQLVANGGVLVIDDFGRQHASPRDLLNRWIVPLESRVDFMTLQTGQKFEVPFDALVVFATNLKPSDLVDEAFLRRIQYKVYAESPTAEQFIQIFENYCRQRDVPFDRLLVESLIDREIRSRNIPLRGCQPRDLIEQSLAIAKYMDEPRRLTGENLAAACLSYFIEDEQTTY